MFSGFPAIPKLNVYLNSPHCLLCKIPPKCVVWRTNAGCSKQWPRWARKAKAHEEPIRGPSSQHQPWEASQLSVWTMGTQLNKNILQKWETEREGGRDLGRNVQASSRQDNTFCLPWDQNKAGLVSRGTKIHQTSAETLGWGHLWFICGADTDFNSCFNNGLLVSKNLIILFLYTHFLGTSPLRPQPLFRSHGKSFLLKHSQLKPVDTQKMLQCEQIWHVEKKNKKNVVLPLFSHQRLYSHTITGLSQYF